MDSYNKTIKLYNISLRVDVKFDRGIYRSVNWSPLKTRKLDYSIITWATKVLNKSKVPEGGFIPPLTTGYP